MSNDLVRDSTASSPATGHGAQWGLASLWLGGLVLLLAPLTLIVNILMAALGPQGLHMAQPETRLASYGLLVAVGLVLLLGLAGLAFGIIALSSARGRGQPAGLPLAGILVSLVALLVFLFTAIDTVFVLAWFNSAAQWP
jgi:hypothetical protein